MSNIRSYKSQDIKDAAIEILDAVVEDNDNVLGYVEPDVEIIEEAYVSVFTVLRLPKHHEIEPDDISMMLREAIEDNGFEQHYYEEIYPERVAHGGWLKPGMAVLFGFMGDINEYDKISQTRSVRSYRSMKLTQEEAMSMSDEEAHNRIVQELEALNLPTDGIVNIYPVNIMYNAGTWIGLPIDESEMAEVEDILLLEGASDYEIADWEGSLGDISQHSNLMRVNEMAQTLADIPEYEREIVQIYAENYGISIAEAAERIRMGDVPYQIVEDRSDIVYEFLLRQLDLNEEHASRMMSYVSKDAVMRNIQAMGIMIEKLSDGSFLMIDPH